MSARRSAASWETADWSRMHSLPSSTLSHLHANQFDFFFSIYIFYNYTLEQLQLPKKDVKCHFAILNSVLAPLNSIFALIVGAKMGCHFNN